MSKDNDKPENMNFPVSLIADFETLRQQRLLGNKLVVNFLSQ